MFSFVGEFSNFVQSSSPFSLNIIVLLHLNSLWGVKSPCNGCKFFAISVEDVLWTRYRDLVLPIITPCVLLAKFIPMTQMKTPHKWHLSWAELEAVLYFSLRVDVQNYMTVAAGTFEKNSLCVAVGMFSSMFLCSSIIFS